MNYEPIGYGPEVAMSCMIGGMFQGLNNIGGCCDGLSINDMSRQIWPIL